MGRQSSEHFLLGSAGLHISAIRPRRSFFRLRLQARVETGRRHSAIVERRLLPCGPARELSSKVHSSAALGSDGNRPCLPGVVPVGGVGSQTDSLPDRRFLTWI